MLLPLLLLFIALALLIRLMHYARFYGPSYFFWIGVVLAASAAVVLLFGISCFFVESRPIWTGILLFGLLLSGVALGWPVAEKGSGLPKVHLDRYLSRFAFREYHEVILPGTPDRAKQLLQQIGVNDIPAIRMLLKIRGIDGDDEQMRPKASKSLKGFDTFSTPDFNFFVVDPLEFVSVMILKSAILGSSKTVAPPPDITDLEQFCQFTAPGYVKVAFNFRFIPLDPQQTLISTETRVIGNSPRDNKIFARYWRIIYPGSAIIRRVWLDTLKKRA